ncbi:hypothetical protein SASPL_155901 [Salvia splendens]|uniref:Oligopeptide transporter n=1 Tax=Salvia splendens TaxID=180675 RepID=A0A8X8VXN0_SALSN|nr:hypothetical protein SASPL_155901 [Salvia splendens]
MARVLPPTPVRIPMTRWSFSLKEHVLITIFANCGAGGVYCHYRQGPLPSPSSPPRRLALSPDYSAYFFPTISVLCYIWKDSILMQQLGSGLHGMGIGSNVYQAHKFPFFSSTTFDDTGHKYNISRILNEATFSFDEAGYKAYSKLHVSTFFAFSYGIGFAMLSATIVHVALYHGKTIWTLWSKTKSKCLCCLSGLVKASANSCSCVVGANHGVRDSARRHNPSHHQHANQTECDHGDDHRLHIPGKAACKCSFQDIRLHKHVASLNIPLRFQTRPLHENPPKIHVHRPAGGHGGGLLRLLRHGLVAPGAALDEGSHWTCPGDNVFYNASIIWGVIGPLRMFTSQGVYGMLNWWFLVWAVGPLPAYFLSRKYPEKKWLRLINMPLILGGTASMPPARAVNYIIVGIAFMAVVIYFTLQSYEVSISWWGLDVDDNCPLATCPTAPGVVVKGCPVH